MLINIVKHKMAMIKSSSEADMVTLDYGRIYFQFYCSLLGKFARLMWDSMLS